MSRALGIIGQDDASNLLPASRQNGTRVEFKGKAALVTLGCAKNQVDSEIMLGALEKRGFEITSDLESADIAIVNTCGFLESAVKESIDTIIDISELKTAGRLRRLIVAGCMVERFKGNINEVLPEVDAFVSLNDILDIANIADGNARSVQTQFEEGARPYFLYDDTMPRRLSTPSHYAYLKISEGCNRPCTFCIIPKIRGPMRSRALESVVKEASELGKLGVREINLVAQDLTAYGSDIKGSDLKDLLIALDGSKSISWIRLLYAYPIGVEDDLLRTIVELPSVCDYLDIPLQHCSENVLKQMKRPLGRFAPRNLVERIRQVAPDLHLRTTFIVGFPGETEEDVEDLAAFVREGQFSSVGVFTYSMEEGTPSFKMKDQISAKEKERRRELIMLEQQRVVKARNKKFEGQILDVIIDGPHAETDLLLSGRTRFQAPEVDGSVIINDLSTGKQVLPGEIHRIEITGSQGYDLIGKVI